METTGKQLKNWAMRIAGLLFCLVLVSAYLVSGMLARYTAGNSGTDTARAARFHVTGAGFTQTLNIGVTMNPGDEKEESITVTNDSEVTVACVITLENTTKNLPLKMKVGGSMVDLDTKYTYTEALAPNNGPGSAGNLTFALVWPAEENDLMYSGMLDNIAVTVTATQVD